MAAITSKRKFIANVQCDFLYGKGTLHPIERMYENLIQWWCITMECEKTDDLLNYHLQQ